MGFFQMLISDLLLIADGFLAKTCNAVSLLFLVSLIIANFGFLSRISKLMSAEEKKHCLAHIYMNMILNT